MKTVYSPRILSSIALGLVMIFTGASLRAQSPQVAAIEAATEPLPASELRIESANAHQESLLEHGVYMREVFEAAPRTKEVALTFDDGPHPVWTPKLLDELHALHVPATFFLVGKMVDKYPELAQREVADGHEVANHTYDHISLVKLTEPQIETELREGAAAIQRAVGYEPYFFRPPGGRIDTAALKAGKALHFTAVMWTSNSGDFEHPAPSVLEQRLLARTHNGAILLCHDGIPQTMQVLPDLVSRLRARGYRFVTVSELLHDFELAHASEKAGRMASQSAHHAARV